MDRWASTRLVYLDNLKVVLIATIIAVHAVLGYTGTIDVWSYTSVREVTLSPVTEVFLLVVLSPFGFILIALLFLVAGLLTPGSLERKGIAPYVRDRLLRLGVPFVLYVLLLQPALMYALEHPLGSASGTYWQEFLGTERQLDTGPLWFVGVLLVFSLGYAGWVAVRRQSRMPRRSAGTIAGRHLPMITVLVAVTSFLVRLVYPYGSESGFTDLNLWQWPACVAVFTIGIVASRQGWLTAVPDKLRRQSRAITSVAAVAMAAFLFLIGALDRIEDAMGGWHWPAVPFTVIECTLSVYGSVWLFAAAQRHLRQRIRFGAALSRSAYGAFMVQAPILIGLAVAIRPLPLPAEAKGLIVAVGGVASAFALAWLLIRRVPAVARIL